MKNNYDDENYIEIIKEYKIKTKDIKIEILEDENDKLKKEIEFMEEANQKLANIIYDLKNKMT